MTFKKSRGKEAGEQKLSNGGGVFKLGTGRKTKAKKLLDLT